MLLLLLAWLSSFGGSAGAADIYTYKDESGTVHAVDSLDAVPERYRDKTRAFVHAPEPEPAKAAAEPSAPVPAPVAASSGCGRDKGTTTCAGKRYCATFYMSPWTDKNNKVLLMETYLDFGGSADKGLRIVVGGEKLFGQDKARANVVGHGAITDDYNEIAKTLGEIQEYPSFFVQDNGKTILTGEPALKWIRCHFGTYSKSELREHIKTWRGQVSH